MNESFFERFAFDINDCVRVLILPIELPSNREDILFVLIGVSILGGLCELIVVYRAIP